MTSEKRKLLSSRVLMEINEEGQGKSREVGNKTGWGGRPSVEESTMGEGLLTVRVGIGCHNWSNIIEERGKKGR